MIDHSTPLNYRTLGLDTNNYVLGCYAFDFREVTLPSTFH